MYKRTNERGCTACSQKGSCPIPDEGVEKCQNKHKPNCQCTDCSRRRRGGGTIKGGWDRDIKSK